MLLGKRSRPPLMKRTTSLTEFTIDPNTTNNNHDETPHSSCSSSSSSSSSSSFSKGGPNIRSAASADGVDHRPPRRNSADFIHTSHFLRSCSLCKRRLLPGRDIFMYKGDGAFCSLECRQQQMNQDEKKDKCSLASKKAVPSQSSSAAAAAATVAVSAKPSETVTAM